MFFLFAVTCFENQVNGWQATFSTLHSDWPQQWALYWAHSNQCVSTQESFFGRIQGYLKEPRTGSQCSFGKNWSPKKLGDLEAKVILSCCFPEAECFPLCPSLCMSVRPTASSGCSGLPGSAWQRLSVQTSTRTDKESRKPNSEFPPERTWLLQLKAGTPSSELWEVGSYHCLLRRSHGTKIPQRGACTDSLKTKGQTVRR